MGLNNLDKKGLKMYWAGHFDKQLEKNPDDAVKALNFSNAGLMNQVHEELLSCIDWSLFKSGDNLLDTGCGTGALLCRLIKTGTTSAHYRYHATDISQAMLKKARTAVVQQFKDCQPCTFHCMSVDDMGFDDRIFSLVLASESLQYTDPYAAIMELIRVTGKNGQIIISIPNSHSPFIKKAVQRHGGRFSGIVYQKAVDLIRPRVGSFFAKSLVFAENQDEKPYLSKPLAPDLTHQDIQQANRFIIKLVM
jgi:ubiquinone/menaquinone biosynthesis C-methylase UbiE